ncbi:MAG: signal peptidase II [Candidatus Absconditabacterales bacterium]
MSHFKIIASVIALLAIDIVTKYLFFNLELLPGIFEATFNTGISFSISINQVMVQIITIIFIGVLARLTNKKTIHPRIGILLIAGALGNLVDRILLGGVRDFIWLGFGPVFNIADVCITLGACYLVIFEFIGNRKKHNK